MTLLSDKTDLQVGTKICKLAQVLFHIDRNVHCDIIFLKKKTIL